MQQSIIQHHIANFHYQSALELIREHGDTAFADRYLGMNRTSFTERKILQHLHDWLSSLSSHKDIQMTKGITDHRLTDPPNTESPTTDTPELTTIIDTKNKLVAKRDSLKATLELIPTDAERKEVALQIVALTKEIFNHWLDINMLREGKPLPVAAPSDELEAIFEGVTDLLQLDKIRRNHVSYLSKARKGLRPADKIPFYEQVIAEAINRINDLKQ